APDRGHRPAHPVPPAQGAGSDAHRLRPAEGHRPDRRGHRADPGVGVRVRGPAVTDNAAGDRRDPGPRDPGHAAAQAGRPGAAGTHQRARRARGQDCRLRGHPGLAAAAAGHRRHRAGRDRPQVRRRPAHRDRRLRRRGGGRGPDRRGRRGGHHHLRRFAKRTKTDLYRAQRRGGKGVRGAQLRTDDIVDHFFVTTTHHWILFFTNKGRVYRAKAYELPDAGRDARGQHVANLLAFQPDERIAEVLALRDYQMAPYLVLATRGGLVKKSKLTAFENVRSGGIIAINLREDDEVIAARLVSPEDDLLLVSKGAQAIRFHADDDSLRPMGRDTSGVIGMRFSNGDGLLGMYVVRDGGDVLVATGGGY